MSDTGFRGGRVALALVAVVAGVTLLVIAIAAQRSAPAVPRGAAGIVHAPRTQGGSGAEPPKAAGKPLPASVPVSIAIPAIGVRSAVFPIGKNPDGTLAVPSGSRLNQAAWFLNSPTPGQSGPSVIEGHVDSTEGPSVFFKLGALRPGDKISVVRRDRSTVVFEVNAVRDYPKSAFPTKLVYGGDLGTATLRLITCSDFDPSIGHHTGNAVVFAHMTHVDQPRRQTARTTHE